MKILISTLSLTVLLLGIISAQAQKKPEPAADFSGTWVWVKEEQGNLLNNGLILTGSIQKGPKKISEELTINQTPEAITLHFHQVWPKEVADFEKLYFLDGRGEVNSVADDPQYEVVSRTTVKKDKITIEGDARKAGAKKLDGIVSTKVFKLSKDARTMTVENDFFKDIYKRK